MIIKQQAIPTQTANTGHSESSSEHVIYLSIFEAVQTIVQTLV
ncbi:unnamed protein product, partial [marine sediment metagenome]